MTRRDPLTALVGSPLPGLIAADAARAVGSAVDVSRLALDLADVSEDAVQPAEPVRRGRTSARPVISSTADVA